MKKSFVKLLVVGLLSSRRGLHGSRRRPDRSGRGQRRGGAHREQSRVWCSRRCGSSTAGSGASRDHALAANVRDLVENRSVCIRHRAGETAASKQAIINALSAAGLFSAADAAAFPGGALAGVLPPVLQPGSGCPHLPQPFFSAPGSVFGGHHSYPGGLPIHETFNDLSDDSLASNYRRVYGTLGTGRASADRRRRRPRRPRLRATADFDIDQSIILAAPLLHDWGKPIVFQWNADGTEFAEFNFGGNGATDNYGAAGDSRTGAHHIIGIAESMARGLSPKFVITQASAHSNPTSGNEYKVVNWLRSAAIIAGIDPVAKGYLRVDGAGNLRLPAVQHLGEVDLNAASPTQVNAPVEYQLHNLSDADFTQTGPAVAVAQILLSTLAPEFGFSPSDTANYNLHYRNPALSNLSAERLYILYTNGGLAPSAPSSPSCAPGDHLDWIASSVARLRRASSSRGGAGPLGGPDLL